MQKFIHFSNTNFQWLTMRLCAATNCCTKPATVAEAERQWKARWKLVFIGC